MSEPDHYHPEEMKAACHLKIGDRISLQGSARVTPAIILLACANLVRASRSR